MWKDIKRLIQKHQTFLLSTHQNPDGDGIGAACALIELLQAQGKTARLVCDSPIPERFAFLDFHQAFEEYDPKKDYDEYQVLLILDTHRLGRIGRLAQLAQREYLSVACIDHHICRDPFTPWTVVDSEACSVGAMIYTLFKESGFELNQRAAMGIYASIICDTGRFSYASTSRKAHKLADECLKLGVDPNLMHDLLFQQLTVEQVKVFSRSIQSMEFHCDNRVVVQQVLLEDSRVLRDKESQDLEYFHEFNKTIREVECTVVLWQLTEDEVRISVRSKFDLNIEEPMRKMGGGGHSRAAGASLKGSIGIVKEKVLSLLSECLQGQRPCDQENKRLLPTVLA